MMTPSQHAWHEFGGFSGPVAGRGRALARLAPAARVTSGRSCHSGCARLGGGRGGQCWSQGSFSPVLEQGFEKGCQQCPGGTGVSIC